MSGLPLQGETGPSGSNGSSPPLVPVRPPPAGGGDVQNSPQGANVSAIQGRPVSSKIPLSGQVLEWNGSAWTPTTAGGAAVTSVFTRTGAVTASTGDYSVSQVTGAAPLASPTFTGTPAAPTPAASDSSTKLATTAYVQAQGYLTSAPVTSVDGRTGTVTGLADLTSGSAQVFSGSVSTGPTVTSAGGGGTAGLIETTAGVVSAVRASAGQVFGSSLTTDTTYQFNIQSDGTHNWGPGGSSATDTVLKRSAAGTLLASSAGILSSSPSVGVGYATGAGGTVSQLTSRTTGVTLNKICGAITLVSASGSSTWNTFTVTNSTVASTDVITIHQATGANLYNVIVTAVGSGSFKVSVSAVSGTTLEAPVLNFQVHKSVTA